MIAIWELCCTKWSYSEYIYASFSIKLWLYFFTFFCSFANYYCCVFSLAIVKCFLFSLSFVVHFDSNPCAIISRTNSIHVISNFADFIQTRIHWDSVLLSLPFRMFNWNSSWFRWWRSWLSSFGSGFFLKIVSPKRTTHLKSLSIPLCEWNSNNYNSMDVLNSFRFLSLSPSFFESLNKTDNFNNIHRNRLHQQCADYKKTIA